MTLLDETLTTAADLGRAAASQATGAANLAGRGISDVAHQGQAVFDDLGDTVTGPDRNVGRRIMMLAAVAAIAGIVIWRKQRSDRHDEPEQNQTPETSGTGTTPGAAATPDVAMSPNVDVAARTDASR
ncbi:MAG: hypothetical protein ACE367_10575 [Acidimicrobiales bacterium]